MTLPVDRLQEQIERIVAATLPRIISGQLALHTLWEYRVVGVIGAFAATPITVSGVPVDPVRCPFGPLTNITVWKGPGGSPSVPAIGSIVAIGFHDGNAAKPAIMQIDPQVPTVPPAGAYVPESPLTLAGALTTFATGLTVGTLTTNATELIANLVPLL